MPIKWKNSALGTGKNTNLRKTNMTINGCFCTVFIAYCLEITVEVYDNILRRTQIVYKLTKHSATGIEEDEYGKEK